jgi:hypothetical protein
MNLWEIRRRSDTPTGWLRVKAFTLSIYLSFRAGATKLPDVYSVNIRTNTADGA